MSFAPWQAGDELTSSRLEGQRAEARAGSVVLAPGCGLVGAQLPDGVHLRAPRALDFWFKVVSAVPNRAGWYNLAQQVEATAGGWADGPRQVQAYERNGNSAVPTSSGSSVVRVRAIRGPLRWGFEWGKCS